MRRSFAERAGKRFHYPVIIALFQQNASQPPGEIQDELPVLLGAGGAESEMKGRCRRRYHLGGEHRGLAEHSNPSFAERHDSALQIAGGITLGDTGRAG